MIDKQYLKDFFMISALKCSRCSSLGILIGKDFHCINEFEIPKKNKKKIIKPKDFAIYNIQDWEGRVNTMLKEIVKYKQEALLILPLLEKDWIHSCNAVKKVLDQF